MDLAPGESDSTSLTQVVDGSVSQVVLSGRGGPEGPDIQVTRMGLFESVPYSIQAYPNQVYVLRFDAPLHFVVNATLASGLTRPSCRTGRDSPVPTLSQWGLGALALLLLSGVALKFGRRRAVTA